MTLRRTKNQIREQDEQATDEKSDTEQDEQATDEKSDTEQDEQATDEKSDTEQDEKATDEKSDTEQDEKATDEKSDTEQDEKATDEKSDTEQDEKAAGEAAEEPAMKPETAKKPVTPASAQDGVTPGKIRFRFDEIEWSEVIDWFAEQNGFSLFPIVQPPEGTFKYFDDQEYTVLEGLDQLNHALMLQGGYTLIRNRKMLVLTKKSEGYPSELIEEIESDDLNNRGKVRNRQVYFLT